MVPKLEEELVFEEMNKDADRKHLLDRVEALRSLDFKIDDKKIEKAIERYELMQAYNPKKSNLKSRINKILSEKIEHIKEEPGTLSVRVGRAKKAMKNGYYLQEIACGKCGEYSLYGMHAKITYLKKLKNGEIIKQQSDKTLFHFCESCGSIR